MKVMKSKERIAAFYAVLVSIILLLASFYDTDAEVYLFPRIAAVIVALLALILVIDALSQDVEEGPQHAELFAWRLLLPGFIIGIIYVLSLERVGFYTCSFFAFFAICIIYGKRSPFHPGAFLIKLGVTLLTMMVLYLLFWKLLNVRTPTGILF